MYLARTFSAYCRKSASLSISHLLRGKPQLMQERTSTSQSENNPVQIVSKQKSLEIMDKVSRELTSREQGRLFAVVQLCGKQYIITSGDVVLIQGYWSPHVGDEIRLEKVLLAGGRDFTLIGQPLLKQGLVDIKATVVEETISHTKTVFKKKRRKQFMRINFQRTPMTMLRIKSIEIDERKAMYE